MKTNCSTKYLIIRSLKKQVENLGLASYPMGTGDSFSPGVKRDGRGDHSSPSSVGVKNTWSCTSTAPYVFMVWCLIKHRDNFNFM